MGRNKKGGYSAKNGINARNTEQIRVRAFLEDATARPQIPPRPACPRDEILEGFLCRIHRNGTTAHSTGLPIFVLDAPPCVTKYRAVFCAEFTAAGNRRGRIETAKCGGLRAAIRGHEKNADACPTPAFFLSVFHSTRSTSAPCAVPPVRSSRNAAYSSALVTTTGVTVRQPALFSPLIAPSCVTKFWADFCVECIDRAAAGTRHAPAFTANTNVAVGLTHVGLPEDSRRLRRPRQSLPDLCTVTLSAASALRLSARSAQKRRS